LSLDADQASTFAQPPESKQTTNMRRSAIFALGLTAVHAAPQWTGGFGPPESSFTPGQPARLPSPCNQPGADRICWGSDLPPDFGFRPPKTKRDDVNQLKERIKDLEIRLTQLQNKPDKERGDYREMAWLRDELERIAGVVKIIAPPGTITTLTPGKKHRRQILVLPPGGSSSCPTHAQAQMALDQLKRALDNGRLPGRAERAAIAALEASLRACGMRLEYEEVEDWERGHERDDGWGGEEGEEGEGDEVVWTFEDGRTLWPRGQQEEQLNVAGLEAARDAILTQLSGAQAGEATLAVLQRINALILSAEEPQALRARQDVFKLGEGACQLADVLALKAALAALSTAYGHPSAAPPSIYLVEQVIVSALQICKQEVPGWTTITPGNPVWGGPMVPEKPSQGGSLVPEKPSQGGGSLVPEKPSQGGSLVPERPGQGGSIVPDKPGAGSEVKPSD
jgi:hypothetical protein